MVEDNLGNVAGGIELNVFVFLSCRGRAAGRSHGSPLGLPQKRKLRASWGMRRDYAMKSVFRQAFSYGICFHCFRQRGIIRFVFQPALRPLEERYRDLSRLV